MLAPHGARDARIDWLRGLALVSIFINHMPGNRFENWTTRNFGFSDAAEVFVLLAGVAAAFAFFRKFETGGVAAIAARTVRRAGTLYTAHIFSTLAAIALFAAVAQSSGNPGYLDLIGIAPLFSDPMPGMIGIAAGTFQLGYFNILPMYVLLIFALPAYLWLARIDLRLMLGVSAAVYLATQMLRLEMPNYPEGGGWFFNPFAWQLLFAIGIALGVTKLRGRSVPYNAVAYALAAGWVVLAAVWHIFSLGGNLTHGLLPAWMDTLHKSYLPPPRLLHVLALGYLLVHARIWERLRDVAAADRVLTLLGRNSLPAFVVGSLASMVGYLTLVSTGSDLALEVLLVMAGVAVMWIAAIGSEHGVLVTARRCGQWIAARLGAGAATKSDVDDGVTTTRRRP